MPDRRRAWARALFLAAPDREARASFADALEALAAPIEGSRAFASSSPTPPPQGGEGLRPRRRSRGAPAGRRARRVFGRFCSLIVDKGRAPLLPQIARSYGAMRDADEGIARLEVEAAREPDGEALDRIAEGLDHLYRGQDDAGLGSASTRLSSRAIALGRARFASITR